MNEVTVTWLVCFVHRPLELLCCTCTNTVFSMCVCISKGGCPSPLLSSVLANQMPCCSVTLSEDKPTYSQCGPLLSVCVFLPSLNLPAFPVASFTLVTMAYILPPHAYKPVSMDMNECIFSTQNCVLFLWVEPFFLFLQEQWLSPNFKYTKWGFRHV